MIFPFCAANQSMMKTKDKLFCENTGANKTYFTKSEDKTK